MSPHTPSQTAAAIAELVDGELQGAEDIQVHGVSDFDQAQAGHLTLIGTQRYADRWADCPATTALIKRGLECANPDNKTIIWVDNADLAFNKTLSLFAPPPVHTASGIHPTACVSETARVPDSVKIGPFCVIGPGVTLGENCVLHNNVTILDETKVGKDCTFWPGVVIRDRCTIGDRCAFHPNAVIGADGFGYRPQMTENGPTIVKTPQIGTVQIGNDVEVGAGACIDRAKCNATIIGDGCKIDNLVQIGHNCQLGRLVVVSGCTGIGGSTVIGDGTMIGGHGAIADHVVIGKGVQLAGGSMVATEIPDGAICGGMPARPLREAMREIQALKRLPDLLKELRRR